MGRFDFGSPGAAFTETMAKVLAERKADERQQMLDRLTQTAEERAGRAEERAMLSQQADNAWREAQTADMNARREDEQFNTLTKFLDPNKPLSQQNITPEQVKILEKRGAIRKRVTGNPSVSTAETFTPPEGTEFEGEVGPAEAGPSLTQIAAQPSKEEEFFAGTLDFQKREDLKRTHGSLIVGLLSGTDPAKKEIGEYLAQLAAANDGLIPEQALAALQPNKPFYSYENETGDLVKHEGGVPWNAEVRTRTRPPRDPVAWRPQPTTMTTPDGNPIAWNPTTARYEPQKDIVIGGREPGSREYNIPQGFVETHGMNIEALGTDPESIDVDNFNYSANAIIEQVTTLPNARRVAQLYLQDPARAEQEVNNLTPAERNEFARVLRVTKASDYRELLERRRAEKQKMRDDAAKTKAAERAANQK